MTLAELAAEEDRLCERVTVAWNNIPYDEIAAVLHAEGVLGRYDAVYHTYTRLIAEPTHDDEALKRALFLQWIAFIQGTELTGIAMLDRDVQRAVLEAVQQRILSESLNNELLWMLRWYDSNTEWYFDDFPDLPVLRRFLQDKYPAIHLAEVFTRNSLQGRGQMGTYWLNMLLGQERNSTLESCEK